MDKEPYRYQEFISDIAGQDIHAHNNDAVEIVTIVRNWLTTASRRKRIPGGRKIWEHYQGFKADLPQLAQEFQLEAEALIYNDFVGMIVEWLTTQPNDD